MESSEGKTVIDLDVIALNAGAFYESTWNDSWKVFCLVLLIVDKKKSWTAVIAIDMVREAL